MDLLEAMLALLRNRITTERVTPAGGFDGSPQEGQAAQGLREGALFDVYVREVPCATPEDTDAERKTGGSASARATERVAAKMPIGGHFPFCVCPHLWLLPHRIFT